MARRLRVVECDDGSRRRTVQDRTRTWVYQFAGTGERLALSNGGELDVDTIFAGMLELPGD